MVSSNINDSYCLNRVSSQLLTQNSFTDQTMNNSLSSNVKYHVVQNVPSAPGLPQRKGLSPGVSDCHQTKSQLKSVKSASCVTQLLFANPVSNAPNAVPYLPVGARLQKFWKSWLKLGAGPKVVQILKEGYTLPFRVRPKLTRSPTVISCYVNPQRNSYLLEALHQLIDKNAVEQVINKTSLSFFNRLFLVPKPNDKWRPILDLSHLNPFLKTEKFKMETPETIRTSLQGGEWVTSIDFKDAYFHIPIQEQSRKYLRFHVQGQTYQFKALPFGLSTAPLEFTVIAKEVKLMATCQGIRIHQYLDDWLVRAGSHQLCLRHTQHLVKICQDLGWLVNLDKSELEPKQIFDFVGYQFDLKVGRVRPTPDRWQSLQGKILEILDQPTCPVRQFMSLIGLLTATEKQVHLGRLHMRPIQWHLKNNWHVPESLEKVIPIPVSLHPHLQWWLLEENVLSGQPLHPVRHALQLFTDASKEGWGALHCKRLLVLTRKQTAYQLLGAKGSSSCSQRVHRSLYRSNSTCGNRQHHSSFLHKQRRRHEIRPPVCPSLENPDLVFPAAGNLKSPSHSRPAKCNSGQAIPSGSDHSDRVVPSDRSVSDLMPKVAPTSDRPIRYEVQPQAAPVCISSTGLPSGSSGCPHSVMGGPGCLCLPANSHIGQSSGKVNTLPVQENHSDCPGLAQHGLVLGLGEHVQPSSHLSAHPAKPVNSTLQSDPSQESDKSEPACMAPRATAVKQQGFSEAVAERIEAPQRRSTRSVYEAKWAVFTKWCIANQVDFRSPPVKSVADFLLYLFEDKNLQPSTIDGYRSAIADKLGSTTVNISKDENLTRLLESFHRDRPKGRRGIPSWNLSLVLHQLTKAPFEPLRDASLKHLTLKTVFLLALGSGKRSEIHAWQHKNIRHQTDWSKVSLYPSPSFLSKNQLAREGPESVAPVVIPALAPTLDRSLKSDRSLCPVRALRYYLDRTSDTRQGKDLVFVSFKKGFDKDISPATISSWIKQTVILCYELSDHHAHTLHQVKAHDIRAFAASKAFQSGVSLEQILSACHWKSHNTFTQFYLKDVAWADSELFHLGPVVAAQQIHQQTGT